VGDGSKKSTIRAVLFFQGFDATKTLFDRLMFPRSRYAALLGLLISLAPLDAGALENQYFRNGGSNAAAESGHNNGADIAGFSGYLSGWVSSTTGSGLFDSQGQSGNTVLPPSDVASADSFDSAYWDAQRSTLIGEAVALRLEVTEFRRLVILALGILFGFETMKYLFRWV
jgi:hypothetical protein